MKITKEQLRQIIKEEIGALTEYSGAEEVAKRSASARSVRERPQDLDHNIMMKDKMAKARAGEPGEPKLKSDVGRVAAKLEKTSGMEGLLAAITNRQEFEQLMLQFIQMVSKEKLKPDDVKMGIRNVAATVLKAK